MVSWHALYLISLISLLHKRHSQRCEMENQKSWWDSSYIKLVAEHSMVVEGKR